MRIIVKNLPFNCTEDELRNFYEKYGTITDVYIPEKNNKKRTFGFVGFLDENDSLKTDKMYFKNKRLDVSRVSENKIERACGDGNILFMANIPNDTSENHIKNHFKEYKIKEVSIIGNTAKVEFEEKCVAKIINENKIFLGRRVYLNVYKGKSQMYYNGLFFDFESIVDRVSEETKISKEKILNLEDKNLGTRIALLESHLVEQTKNFLILNDINLDNITHKRYKNKLIVRNYNLLTDIPDCNIKIAPSKCLAILEFDTDEKASEFYKNVHMKRVGNKPIYCEYLPVTKPSKLLKFTTKLIVKNVPFQATVKDIKNLFGNKYKIKVRLPKKNDEQHRGFCFIFTNNEEESKEIYQYFGSSTHLFGRRLVIEPAKN